MTNFAPPLLVIKAKMQLYVAQRSTELVLKANSGEIDHKEYQVQQFPPDMGSLIDEWFTRAQLEWDEEQGR